MPSTSRPRRIRPSTAPAYYLGRPASAWLRATSRTRAPEGAR